MLLYAFKAMSQLLYALRCFLYALEAKVSPQADRWSRVYRFLPAEAGKKPNSELLALFQVLWFT